jgi:phage tail-like protein
MNGVDDRRSVTIVLLNERREAVLRWHAENAWINKIEGPTLKASSNDVAMESLELVHEGLTIEM